MSIKIPLQLYRAACAVSLAALLSACASRQIKCETPQIPPELLTVPQQDQVCELAAILGQSCTDTAGNASN